MKYIHKVLLPESIEALVTSLGGGVWQCIECGYQSKKSTTVKNHVEAKHLPSDEGYPCSHCHEVLRNKIALQNHLARRHKY